MKTRTTPYLLVSCALLALAQAASADSVSGEFKLGDQALKPSEVAAFRVRDQFHARQRETYVMLTTQPVNKEAIANSSDPYAVAINDDAVRDADYLAISVEADGKATLNAHVGGTQYLESSGKIMGQQGSLIANCTVNTAERVACNVKVAKPVKPVDSEAWTLDVTFDVQIRSRPAGKPISKDGGEPGKAFLALVSAAQGSDLAKILALLAPSEAEDYQRDYNTPEENLESAKSTLGFQLPKKPKITGGEMSGDDIALLEVEGVPFEDGKMLYVVEMQLSDGKWGFSSAHIAGMLK